MDRSKLQISEKQVLEWTENPVTIALAELCKAELSLIDQTPRTDCLVYGDPQKSHENLIELDTRTVCWNEWVAFLTGDWSVLEEEENE
jgi:hypothetical protein